LAKPYDSTAKFLVEAYPADWLALAGLAPTGPIEVIDANLSTITAEADKVLRVGGPAPWLAHVELQAGREAHLPRRLLRYNTLLDDRHDLPTRSLVVLLRPAADGPDLTGVYRRGLPGGPPFLEFRYDVVRAWRQPVESVLAGGLGTLPLAPVSDLAESPLEEVIRRMADRIDRELPPTSGELWVSTGILMGLRYPPDVTEHLLRGVRNMKESSFYQMILAEGEAKGEVKGARKLLASIGRKRLGEPDARTAEKIESLSDLRTIEILMDKCYLVSSWEELLG